MLITDTQPIIYQYKPNDYCSLLPAGRTYIQTMLWTWEDKNKIEQNRHFIATVDARYNVLTVKIIHKTDIFFAAVKGTIFENTDAFLELNEIPSLVVPNTFLKPLNSREANLLRGNSPCHGNRGYWKGLALFCSVCHAQFM